MSTLAELRAERESLIEELRKPSPQPSFNAVLKRIEDLGVVITAEQENVRKNRRKEYTEKLSAGVHELISQSGAFIDFEMEEGATFNFSYAFELGTEAPKCRISIKAPKPKPEPEETEES